MGGEKLEKTLKFMIKKGIHGYFLQEMWLLSKFSKTIRGHLLLHHGMTIKPCLRGRASCGVAIILGPVLLWAWDMTGKPPPITSAPNSDFPGRMIGFTLCFPDGSNKRVDKFHKRGKGKIKIFLASIYHPVDHEDQKRFNEELAIFYNSITRNSELLSGQYVNCNIGIRSKMFRDVIGPYGINNRNAKGKDLLFLLNSIKFIVLLTYYRHENYNTWRSFNTTRSPHLLDNFILSQSFFCQVKYCKVVNIGMDSDHTAILTSFKPTAIKFKFNEKIAAHIDWKLIGYHKLTNKLLNSSLSKSVDGSITYYNYNKHILEAGTNTATINNQKNKGWYHFSSDSLLPLIEEIDALRSDYLTLGIGKGDSSETNMRLKIAQIAVEDSIALAKADWSAHQA